jgi:hypothetical protein
VPLVCKQTSGFVAGRSCRGPGFAGPFACRYDRDVILEKLEVTPGELQARTGWELRPEGLCKADRCVPLPDGASDRLEVQVLAERLGMALVHDPEHGLWALGPESGGRALLSAKLPDVSLPDRRGDPFSLSSLRGTKVIMVAWASW